MTGMRSPPSTAARNTRKALRTADDRADSTANDRADRTADDRADSTTDDAPDAATATATTADDNAADATATTAADDSAADATATAAAADSTVDDRADSTANDCADSTADDRADSTADDRADSTADDRAESTWRHMTPPHERFSHGFSRMMCPGQSASLYAPRGDRVSHGTIFLRSWLVSTAEARTSNSSSPPEFQQPKTNSAAPLRPIIKKFCGSKTKTLFKDSRYSSAASGCFLSVLRSKAGKNATKAAYLSALYGFVRIFCFPLKFKWR